MRHFEKGRALPNASKCSFPAILALLSGAIIFASPIHAQTSSTIISLSQLTEALGRGRTNQIVRDIKLEAKVFASSTNSGVLILQDQTAAELFEIEGLEREFLPGDIVRIEARQCFFDATDIGVFVSASPLINLDGIHAVRTNQITRVFTAGRYPVRVDWFNQFGLMAMTGSCVARNIGEHNFSKEESQPNLIHITRAECYEGYWSWLPNFRRLQPVKIGQATNLDVGFRTRDEMVGIRFDGFLEVPATGEYLFTLCSDDGARLWVGSPEVPIMLVGSGVAPTAPSETIGEPMASLNERRLVALEGRVDFISKQGKGMQFEMRSEQRLVSVSIADSGTLKPDDLLNAYVRVAGVAAGVLNENQRVVLGRLAVATSRELTILQNAPGKGTLPPVLNTVAQVHDLSSEDAARHLPVKIQGVVTAVGWVVNQWMAIQDETRGIFVSYGAVPNQNHIPKVGEFWSVTGHTQPGDFSPVIIAERMSLVGQGRMPEPIHPTWNQLVNGSVDVQWGEIQGLVTDVQSNIVTLLLREGHQRIRMPEWGESELKPYEKSVVRIRGTFFALWNAATHEVLSRRITIHNASISVDRPSPDDPFDAPEKTPRGLFLFDAKATPFQRVKVRGQITYADAKRVFVERGSGIEVLPVSRTIVHVGDFVEAVGYPDVSGATPVLREALLRNTGKGVLAQPPLISDSLPADERFELKRIRLEGHLAEQHTEKDTLVLQIESHTRLVLARLANAKPVNPFRLGSKLALAGIYVPDPYNGVPSGPASHFELLLNSPDDVTVLAEPSWWTLQRLLSAVGVLVVTLALAAAWITQLRRQVTQRTLQLRHEIREREHAERQHALEAERSRIARDLHDDLGSSLTEIKFLASTGQRPQPDNTPHPVLFRAIADRARRLIAALDEIVWAVNPDDNSLQSVADYLSGYAQEYLDNSRIASRFKIPVTLPNIRLDGEIRHELLMVVKETLNNIVRHADATEVEFQMSLADETFEICIADNGKGFDPQTPAGGHGLKNRTARLARLGGICEVESRSGAGTTVHIRLPLQRAAAQTGEEANTTFGVFL